LIHINRKLIAEVGRSSSGSRRALDKNVESAVRFLIDLHQMG
jgi:hypothetical protein